MGEKLPSQKQNTGMSKKKIFTILVLLVILATVFRFGFALMTHNAGDGCWHLSAARVMASDKVIPYDQEIGRDYYPYHVREYFWAPPLFHFAAAGFYMAFSP